MSTSPRRSRRLRSVLLLISASVLFLLGIFSRLGIWLRPRYTILDPDLDKNGISFDINHLGNDYYPMNNSFARALALLREQLLTGRDDSFFKCKKRVRVGSSGDGGWYMCEDYPLPSDCIIYSIGIANDYSFDVQVSKKYGCKVYSFDPTVNHTPVLDDVGLVKFFKLGSAGKLSDPPSIDPLLGSSAIDAHRVALFARDRHFSSIIPHDLA